MNDAPAIMNIQKILSMLPHRYPFLMVDRVTECIPDVSIKAYKCVTFNEPFFQGHFPDLPVMPGVMIIEALAQAGGLMVLAGMEKTLMEDSIFLFTGIEKVRFRRQVSPGDTIDLHCTLLRKKMQLWKMQGKAYVDGVLAAEAELTAAMVRKGDMA